MTYATLLETLYAINIEGHTKYNLDTMLKLCALFESPEKKIPTVHVAGTNGKGSVTTKIAKSLELSGLKVGLFTSPHISCFRERIRINGEMISEAAAEKHLSKILTGIKEHGIKASFFEITTLLSFCYYAEEKVDIAVIETGLGGRLDATNVITPLLSVITSISLEHTTILGNTLAEIAVEKAGIIKLGIPVVIGSNVPFNEIRAIAEEKKAPLYTVQGVFPTYNDENNAIVKKALELLYVSDENILGGCSVMPPCRLEKVILKGGSKEDQPLGIILDVAHNPDGLKNLFVAVERLYPGAKLRIVCGLSENKEIPACVSLLKENGSYFHLVQANNSRALDKDILQEEFLNQNVAEDRIFVASTIEQSLDKALEMAVRHQEVLVVCGSFYIMSEVRANFGIVEPRDIFDLNGWSLDAV
ncbi:MAG: bifunctional folylpolyglutamate synthase/dihydrofolate synthase [Parachlamydiaceae bacterium]|nr:bifunctional folylpolyglutamate synthase/dihydrofolate synthase [Parachlamydiaceae bacterium]